jgi:hypothetical protein
VNNKREAEFCSEEWEAESCRSCKTAGIMTKLSFYPWFCRCEEAWFRRKTSLKVEMVTDEAGTYSEFRGADSTKHQKCASEL